MKIKILFIAIIIAISCKDEKADKSLETTKIYSNINVDLKETTTIKLSEIYDEINWVTLQTIPESVLGNITKMVVSNNKLYFQSNNSVYIYSENGDFINKISKLGNGPGEYIILSDFEVDNEDGSLLFYDSKGKKILSFSSEGEFIDEIKTNLDAYSFKALDNGEFAVYIGSGSYNQSSNHKLNIINSSGKIIQKHIPINDIESKFLHFGDLTNFQDFGDKKSFLYSFNDTIYNIKNAKIEPRFYVDFGKNKLPEDYLKNSYTDVMDFLETCKKTTYAYRIIGFFEAADILVFSFMHKYDIIHAYYSKETKKTRVVDKYINDFDFLEFEQSSTFENLPKATHDNKFYTITSSYEFISLIDSLKLQKSNFEWANYKVEHPEVFSIYEKIDFNDNPIIMIGQIANKIK